MRKTKVFLGAMVLFILLTAACIIPPIFATSYNIEKTTLDLGVDVRDLVQYNGDLYYTDGTNIYNEQNEPIYNSTTGIISAIEATGNKLIFIKENLYLYILNLENLNDVTEITVYKNGEVVEAFPTQNRAIAVSATGEIYMLADSVLAKVTFDETTDGLILSKICDFEFEEAPLEFANGSFAVNEFGTFGYFSILNNLYEINLQNNQISQISTEITENITDIEVDSLGNIYVLAGDSIYKIGDSIEAVVLGENYSRFTLDYTTGVCYIITDNNVESVMISSSLGNFVTTFSEIEAPIDLYNYTPSTEVVSVLNVNAGTKIYEFQSLNSPATTYTESKSVILIEDISDYFYYVLDSNLNGNFALGYILKSDCTLAQNVPGSEQVRVVVKQTKLYNLPFSVMREDDTSAPFGTRVDYGTVLDVMASPTLPTDCSGTAFYAVEFEGNIYYIDSRTAVGVEYDTAIDNEIVSNASTRAETIVYADESLTEEQDTLEKGYSITVLETKDGVCRIEYLVDGESRSGYVSQSFVNDGTLTTTQIVGIVLMCLSLVLAIIIAIVIHFNNKKHRESKSINN